MRLVLRTPTSLVQLTQEKKNNYLNFKNNNHNHTDVNLKKDFIFGTIRKNKHVGKIVKLSKKQGFMNKISTFYGISHYSRLVMNIRMSLPDVYLCLLLWLFQSAKIRCSPKFFLFSWIRKQWIGDLKITRQNIKPKAYLFLVFFLLKVSHIVLKTLKSKTHFFFVSFL